MIQALEADKRYEVYYGDESGFSLSPSIPYAWQNERIEVNSERSRRINVFGIMNRNNELMLNMFETNIDADVVIACIDKFSKKLKRETVLVLDNASIHKSKRFQEFRKKWRKKGLRILFLPPYSPELNLIEILWRFVKYQWLPFGAYESFELLWNAIFNIFANFGSEYHITFV